MKNVVVDLGRQSYGIRIGRQLAEELASFVASQGYSRRALVVSDANVGALYGERLLAVLRRAGLSAELFMVKAGEGAKSLSVAESIYTRLIELGLDRKSPVFALGGGVVGDLAGFVAATYMRGVPFIQVPTSLLAQVDSSVGGKVAVNHALGKNLIGAFYQPDAVFMDLDLLSSLPPREIRTGLGEIVKYGVIYDEAFFHFLETHQREILALEPEMAAYMIARSCEIKADVVSKDERESGLRRILNFGHTMAHAIERETNYVRYNHGEAVAIGMAGAAYISRDMGLASGAQVERLLALMASLGLPTRADGCEADSMYRAMFHDKKTVDGKVNWVLMEGIGRTSIHDDVPEETVRGAIAACIAP